VNPHAATLRFAVFPRPNALADAALVLAGAAFVALAAQVELHLPFTPVPLTGQTFAVLLVGASLGAVRGVLALAVYFFAGLVGAPVYAGSEGGWDWVEGATGGYLVGFVVAAGVTGWLAERGWDRRFSTAVGAMLTGSVVVYAFGLPWLAAAAKFDFDETVAKGLAPFVPGDVLKLYLAGALLPATWRLVDRATRDRRPPR
jgi:biotin transport system substrate-specific component